MKSNFCEGKSQKRSFAKNTMSSSERNFNVSNAKAVDSLDLHLSATYDHQYDLFVNKADVVSQLLKIKTFHEKEKPQRSTGSISIIFGNDSVMSNHNGFSMIYNLF